MAALKPYLEAGTPVVQSNGKDASLDLNGVLP